MSDEEIIFLVILVSTVSAPTILQLFYLLLDKYFGTHKSCDFLGWHNGKGQTDGLAFDGCSAHAKCSKCGKEVIQDSQGNWF